MALDSPLSENMSEFFLLACLALFSGLFRCAEPSAVSDEDKGKEEPGLSGMRSPLKLGTTGRLVQSGVVTGAKWCALLNRNLYLPEKGTIH